MSTPDVVSRRFLVSIVVSAASIVVIPTLLWAKSIDLQIAEIRQKQEIAVKERDSLESLNKDLRADVKLLRTAIEAMRTELVQRMARVETKLDK